MGDKEDILPPEPEIMYIYITDYLSEENICELNSIEGSKKHDATFIRKLIDFMYENKVVLNYRSVSGRSRNGEMKNPITPEKIRIIHNLFTKRITDTDLNTEEIVSRINENNINRLISVAIGHLKLKKVN